MGLDSSQAEHRAELEFRIFRRRFDKFFGIQFLHRYRLFNQHMHPVLHRLYRQRDMRVMRGRHYHGVHFRLSEKIPAVGKQFGSGVFLTLKSLRINIAERCKFAFCCLFDILDMKAAYHADAYDAYFYFRKHFHSSLPICLFIGDCYILS
ncbi:hypothetical protein SDC9_179663 [bioreactor metagenome]|uniref:Uncharacterized protein n=1 Tax=bioreactor metagenome TaxID=1076179 RepID=A0A645GZI6_9ZZZZ